MIRFGTGTMALGILLFACETGPEPPPIDSGIVIDASPVDSSLVSLIAAPAAVSFTCPPGWLVKMLPGAAGVEVCDAYPPDGPQSCATHEAHFPGEPGCTRVGSVCPADGWPVDMSGDVRVFVDAAATPGGDGSRGAPYATLLDAVAGAPSGAVLLMAAGDYDGPERILVDRPLTFRGACAEGVVIRRPGSGSLAIVSVDRIGVGAVTFEDLTFRSTSDNRLVSASSEIVFRSVVFDGTSLVHTNGELTIEGCVGRGFDDVTEAIVNSRFANGVRIDRLVIHDAESAGVIVASASIADIGDVAVRGIGTRAISISADEILISRAFVDGARGGGIVLEGRVTASDLVARGGDRASAESVGLLSTGSGALSRVWVEGWGTLGLALVASEMTLADVVVTGGVDERGRGIEVAAGARVTLDRAFIFGTRDIGLLVTDAETSLTAADLVIDSVRPNVAGSFGRCLHTQSAGRAALERAELVRCREAGVTASLGASIVLRDIAIRAILPIACGDAGCSAGIGAVALEGGGTIDIERFVIDGAALAGVQVVPDGEIDLRDGVIENNPVGVNVQVDDYDITRLDDRILFRGNGTNLDSTTLPVPAARTP